MQRLARQRDWHLSAILNGPKTTYTRACGLTWWKTNMHTLCVHRYTQPSVKDWRRFGFSFNSLPWAWMRKHLCVKVVPWQCFLLCDQGQHEASLREMSPLAKRKELLFKSLNIWKQLGLSSRAWLQPRTGLQAKQWCQHSRRIQKVKMKRHPNFPAKYKVQTAILQTCS